MQPHVPWSSVLQQLLALFIYVLYIVIYSGRRAGELQAVVELPPPPQSPVAFLTLPFLLLLLGEVFLRLGLPGEGTETPTGLRRGAQPAAGGPKRPGRAPGPPISPQNSS